MCIRDRLEDAKHGNTQLTEAIHASNQHSKQIQQRRHDLQLELVKLSQINERTTHRNQQISSELTEIKQALDHEISLQESAKAKLTNKMCIRDSRHAIRFALSLKLFPLLV